MAIASLINVGTVPNDGTGDQPRTAFQKINGVIGSSFSVQQYGALGDGVADDTTAFQNAINAAALAGGRVSVPATTAKYIITATLTLPALTYLEGQGPSSDAPGPQLNFTNTSGATLFAFTGVAEAGAYSATLRNLQFFGPGSANNAIGLRVRNFDGLLIENCDFNHWTVGVWCDWGQMVAIRGTRFILNTRGVQLGGNISQTTTPVPGTGIRGGSFAPNFLDDVLISKCSFSQNVVDINHAGSQYSLGGFRLADNKFFESSSSPVSGKTLFVHLSGLQNAEIERNSFESPNIRTIVSMENTGLDSDTPGPSWGIQVRQNMFLMTSASGSNVGINVARGQAFIDGNTFVGGAGSALIQLGDTVSSSFVGYNHYLTFVNNNVPTEGFTNPISITGAPTAGHYGYNSATSLNWRSVATTLGQIISDHPTVPQVQFNVSGTRTFGMSSIQADQMRLTDSGGTVKGIFKLSGTTGQFVPPSTSWSFRNNGDTADNLLIGDAGSAIFRLSAAVGTATIATSATVGYLYIPTMSATASGTPATSGGLVALAYETGGNHLMVFSGGVWKQVALS